MTEAPPTNNGWTFDKDLMWRGGGVVWNRLLPRGRGSIAGTHSCGWGRSFVSQPLYILVGGL